jgi:hypothetical protein
MGLLGISGAGSPRSTLRQGLVAAYNMSNSGNLGLDSAGSSNLTNVNAATQAVGKVNNAAQFVRASNQNLTLPDNAALSMGDIDFTLAAWVYLDSKPTRRACKTVAARLRSGASSPVTLLALTGVSVRCWCGSACSERWSVTHCGITATA